MPNGVNNIPAEIPRSTEKSNQTCNNLLGEKTLEAKMFYKHKHNSTSRNK